MQRIRTVMVVLSLLVLTGLPALARDGGDQVRFGQSITVQADEHAGDIVCFGCSVRMLGTSGDVAVFGGSVRVEGHVRGDATVFGGELTLAPGASVDGDVVAFGGGVHRSEGTHVGGDVTNFLGPLWVGAVFLPPIVVIVLVGAFIVWLIMPNRRVQPPVPPGPVHPR